MYALERIYVEEVVRPWQEVVREIIEQYTLPDPAFTRDADGLQLQWLVEQAQRAIDNRRVYQTEKLGQWVVGASDRHLGRTIRAVQSATGVDVSLSLRLGDVRPILEASIRENVGLISKLNADTKARVEQILLDGFTQRKSRTQIARELREAMGITWRRARLIARDQNEKINATLTRYRNQQLGIKWFRWITRLDSRVRRTHRAREGKVYSWARGAPIPERFPGIAINCRCVAEGVIEYAGSSWRDRPRPQFDSCCGGNHGARQ